MLKCTKVKQIESGQNAPFFWSEILTLRVELAFDTSATEDDKIALISEHGGGDAAEAWQRAALDISEAMVQDTRCFVQQLGGGAAKNNNNSSSEQGSKKPESGGPSASLSASYSSAPLPSSSLEAVPSSSGGGGGGGHRSSASDDVARPRQPIETVAGGTESEPTAMFMLTVSIPYCPSAASTTSTASNSGDLNSNSNSKSSTCQWEFLLFMCRSIGPSPRAALIKSEPFALVRHSVRVSTAVLISSRTVPCCPMVAFSGGGGVPQQSGTSTTTTTGAANTTSSSSMMVTPRNNNTSAMTPPPPSTTRPNSTNTSRSAGILVPQLNQNSQQQQRHCLVSVSCRNTCNNHVVIRHVELQAPSWTPALLLLQQEQWRGQGQQRGGTNTDQPHHYLHAEVSADPWVIRRKNPQAAAAAPSSGGGGGSSPSFVMSMKDFSATGGGNNNSYLSPSRGSSSSAAAGGIQQQLLPLSDSLPITLKPSECYTFCFECSGWTDAMLQQQRDSVSLFVARTTVAGRAVLVNHPLHVI